MKTFTNIHLVLVCAGLGASLWAPATAEAQTPPLALADVYAEARQRSPVLRAVEAGARAARTREAAAETLPDPQIEVGIMNASLPDLGTGMPTSMAPAIRVMQMVPFPGKLRLNGEIAKQTSLMAEAAAREAWWEVRTRAALAFYDIHAIDGQIGEMQETLRLLLDFEQVARAMYAAGDGRQSDVLRASVEVSRMTAEITRMEAMRAAAAATLNAVLDRAATTRVPQTVLPPLPAELPAADVLVMWADETRPMLERGRIDTGRAARRVTLARRELWPDFTVGVEYGRRRIAADAMDGAEATARTDHMGSLMVGFSVPLFAGRRQVQMRAEMEAMRQMTEAELSGMRAQVGARISELLAQLDRDRALIQLFRTEVLPQSEAAVTAAFTSYRVGKVDFMTLVDAQMTVNEYRRELIGMVADYGRAIAELEMAVGREIPVTHVMLAEGV